MRILFAVYNSNDVGSVMSTTRRQAEHLASEGHKITIVSNEFPTGWVGVDFIKAQTPDTWAWSFAEYIINGVCRRLPAKFSSWDLRKFLPQYRFSHAIADVIARQREQHIDGIICCQHFCAPGLVDIQRKCGTPFMLIAHGDIFSHPDESFAWPLRVLYRRTAKLSYLKARHIIAVGSALATRAIEIGAKPCDVTVIPNGIDPQDLAGASPDVLPRRAVVQLLFVGRLAAEKAIDVLIRAVAALTLPSVQLRIVGDGPCRTDLTKLVASLRLDDKVEFVGNVPRNGLGSYYQQSDIVVLPSLTEAQGIVILEAAVNGRPVIATNVGGIPDVVKHNWNGLLVPPGDVHSLADAISTLYQSPTLRTVMGANARAMVPNFLWQAVLHRFSHSVTNVFASWGPRI